MVIDTTQWFELGVVGGCYRPDTGIVYKSVLYTSRGQTGETDTWKTADLHLKRLRTQSIKTHPSAHVKVKPGKALQGLGVQCRVSAKKQLRLSI